MKFIFPQNYNIKTKLFGIFDYSTAILNIVWYCLMFFLAHLIFEKIRFQLVFFIVTCLPLFLFSIIGFNHENIFYVIIYLYKFTKNRQVLLFKKY